MTAQKNRRHHPVLWTVKLILKLFYHRHAVIGSQLVEPALPAVFICNHLNSYAPIILSLYFPFPFSPWVHSYIMDRSACPAFLEKDFAVKSLKLRPPLSRWTAAALTPLVIHLMHSLDAIPVYKNSMKIRDTFNRSIDVLCRGDNIIIFPEDPNQKFTEFLNEFQTGFVHLAWQYHKTTGQQLRFYPVYVSQKTRTITIGRTIEYMPESGFHKERAHIAAYLRDTINDIAKIAG